MTEAEFYKRKIFGKAGIRQLKMEFPNQKENIDSWFRSTQFQKIQKAKSRILQKLKDEHDLQLLGKEDFENLIYRISMWYVNEPKVCQYCDLREEDLSTLHQQEGHINKRYPKRGDKLEIDRKQSNLPYSVLANLTLACYWCNNAKTDTFTEEEFRKIGSQIRLIWEQRLGRSL